MKNDKPKKTKKVTVTVRAEAEIRSAAKKRAIDEGTSLQEVLLPYLQRYAAGGGGK